MVYSTEISICVVVTLFCGLHLLACQYDRALDSTLFKIMLVNKQ